VDLCERASVIETPRLAGVEASLEANGHKRILGQGEAVTKLPPVGRRRNASHACFGLVRPIQQNDSNEWLCCHSRRYTTDGSIGRTWSNENQQTPLY
jgi:hypothetical protein